MGMDLWYDVMVQELADDAPDDRELLDEADKAVPPEPAEPAAAE